MSDDINALIGRLRSYMRSSKYIITEDIFAAVDTIEALRAERDRLKAVLEAKQADPAPAVCEWTRTPWGRAPSASPVDALYTPRCDADYLCNVPGSGMCHRCGKPIKFTEAKE